MNSNIKQIFSDVADVLLAIIVENDLDKDEIVATLKAWRNEDNVTVKETL